MNFRNFLFVLLIGCSAYAQELEDPNLFETNNQILRADLYSGQAVSLSQFDGYMKPERTQFSIPQGNVFGEDDEGKINMMALAQTKEWQRKSGIVDMQFPSRQLQQINGQVQVFYNGQANFKYRTDFNLDYYGQGTPDGGIRNEVYQDVTQPMINPYYLNNNYYYPYQRSSRRNSGDFNFYITR
mgnify:CR=1 FL=1